MYDFVEKDRNLHLYLFCGGNRAGKKRQEIIAESMEKQRKNLI